MSERSELERAYRLLLLAYPRFYRRHRGLEMVTTMLDAAKPGQRRPTRADAVHLFLSGLRLRLVPPGWVGKFAAGAVALWFAVVLGGVGAFLVWGTHPRDPFRMDDDIVGAPVTLILSGDQAADHGLLDMAYSHKSRGELQTFGDEGWAGAKPAPMGQVRLYENVSSARAVLDGAYQRLRAQGWQTGEMMRPEACACEVFWASRDDGLVRVSKHPSIGGRETIMITVYRAEPDGVYPAAVAGFVVGLLLAWPVMTWLAHRCARTPGVDRVPVVLFGVAVMCACVANTVDNVLSMVPDPDTGSVLLAADLMYPMANQAANPLASTVIALGLAAIVAVTVFTPLQRLQPVSRSGGAAIG